MVWTEQAPKALPEIFNVQESGSFPPANVLYLEGCSAYGREATCICGGGGKLLRIIKLLERFFLKVLVCQKNLFSKVSLGLSFLSVKKEE